MNPNDIIIRPVISEKTTTLMENNKYVFRVSIGANKVMVAQAINDIFGVQPEKVNTLVVRGKKRRIRHNYGNKSAWKKAIVTLKDGDKIEIFDAQ